MIFKLISRYKIIPLLMICAVVAIYAFLSYLSKFVYLLPHYKLCKFYFKILKFVLHSRLIDFHCSIHCHFWLLSCSISRNFLLFYLISSGLTLIILSSLPPYNCQFFLIDTFNFLPVFFFSFIVTDHTGELHKSNSKLA